MHDLIDAFLTYLTHERRYSAHTIESYARDLAQWEQFAGREYPDCLNDLSLVDAGALRDFLALMMESGTARSSAAR
jgi:integrase/recombinase XerC